MTVSLKSQNAALKSVALLRPVDLVRAGLAHGTAQAELLLGQLKDASATFHVIASDERTTLYVEKALRKQQP